MRIAFTIILNGLHHLKHNNYYQYLIDNLDYWIIVEGASDNKGSTGWCRQMPENYHINGKSIDGTREFILDLQKQHKNVICNFNSNGLWASKDEQVNSAAETINSITQNCFVWEIDADEQWRICDMVQAEKQLIQSNGKTGMFTCNYFVGKDIVVKGQWGEGSNIPYIRLWNWSNDSFKRHEPPQLKNGDGNMIRLPQKFNHYAYYFEQDVKFKETWYTNHEGIYDGWKKLQTETVFPQHIKSLFTKGGYWANTHTYIHKI